MGFLDSITQYVPSFLTLDAEAPPPEKKEEEKDDGAEEEVKEEDEGEKKEEEPAEEEEEEDEPVDPKEELEEECRNSEGCKPHKHEYDECAARVTQQIEESGKAKEDCVEEFFELAHCATSCAAPKLWAQLK